MTDVTLVEIHKTFLEVDKRAERATAEIVAATFVDSAPMFDMLSTRNHQVIYGRRGTGKTHALKYLEGQVREGEDASIYIDMRSIGSNGSIYGDPNRSLSERAGVLIRDVLAAILAELYGIAVAAVDKSLDGGQITIRLDDFQAAISEVRISGQTEIEETSSDAVEKKSGLGLEASASPFKLAGKFNRESGSASSAAAKTRRTGFEAAHLNFGRTASSLSGLVEVLGCARIWLLVDEWSEVPLELQPYLADLIRRCLLPINAITVKIAAIEHRSSFSIRKDRGEYIGIELGADMAADLNLDDFLVFDNDQQRSVEFFKALLFKHLTASTTAPKIIDTPDKLIQALFTQAPVFDEFVRAVEGVPRDALNLMTKMVGKAWGQKAAAHHVRLAARDWYNQDKSRDVRDDETLNDLLDRIINEVIGSRRARAFLFPTKTRDERIETLFDSRILHVLKRNVSSHDEPGQRYDVYKIDYGCYVELINTSKMPVGLYQEEDSEDFIEVPKDDHRSIRRAILRPEELVG